MVVAGPPGDRALVDQTLPAAETAAAYDIKMMGYNTPLYLHQRGFVVFVSGSAAVSNRWLATSPQPGGWPARFLGASAVQLPGPGVTADTAVRSGHSTLVDNVADDTMGGVRVVLGPTAEETSHDDETVTLVREFMLGILATEDEELTNGVPLKPVPAWPQEGLAVAVQFMFESNPNPEPRGRYSFAALTAELRGLPRSYLSGTYPSSAQLFGPSVAADEAWGDVAASAYEYIHSRYDMSETIVSAMELHYAHPTPFGNVYKSGTNSSNLVFFGIHSIRLGWRPWLAGF